MSASLASVSAAMAPAAVPGPVIWSYVVGGAVMAVGLVALSLRGDWQRAWGLEKLVLFGPLLYAAPLAAFGTEHFTLTATIASLVPAWIPWHEFWAYLVGTCFIAGALSLATTIQARLSASLLALTFFLFVALMDVPGWLQDPHNRFALALALRELSFGAGALALAAALTEEHSERVGLVAKTIARYCIAIAVLFYSFEQFLHPRHVPAIPLSRVTPDWVFGRIVWSYLTAAAFAVTGTLLLVGKKTRAAATWLGLSVLFVELVVYVPIAVVDFASLDNGLNYAGDTLMYCGALLMLAGAMPREAERREASADQVPPGLVGG